eukprot:2586679-Alexandrium_andersonii.AAC.1
MAQLCVRTLSRHQYKGGGESLRCKPGRRRTYEAFNLTIWLARASLITIQAWLIICVIAFGR